MKLPPSILFTLIVSLVTAAMPFSIFASDKLPKVIAHRGASFDAPENTKAAIHLAIQKQAPIIEFDVRETRDGGLYLFHDKDLKKLANRDGKFEELTSSQAKQLDVGSWFKKGAFPSETPPSLSEAIQLCIDGNAIPLIEHKTGSPKNYADIILEMGVVEKVVVQSFDWDFIEGIRNLIPELRIGALGSGKLLERKDELSQLKPNWVGWKYNDLDKSDIDWLKDLNFQIAAWTVNDRKAAKRLVTLGVDWIITDRPEYIAKDIAVK